MWRERDVWIPRLLTSNNRVRQTIARNEQKLNEQNEQLDNNFNSSLSSNDDDDEPNNRDKNSINDKDQSDDDEQDNDDDTPTIFSKHSGQRLNIRIRRNKMSFSKDKPTKQRRKSTNQIVDADTDDADDDDDDDDSNDRVMQTHKHSNKKTEVSHDKKHKSALVHSKTSVIIHPYNEVIEQVKTLVKAKSKTQDIVHLLTKQTGLNKSKAQRFLHSKDLSILTVEQFIQFLNSLQSTIKIVSQ